MLSRESSRRVSAFRTNRRQRRPGRDRHRLLPTSCIYHRHYLFNTHCLFFIFITIRVIVDVTVADGASLFVVLWCSLTAAACLIHTHTPATRTLLYLMLLLSRNNELFVHRRGPRVHLVTDQLQPAGGPHRTGLAVAG